MRLNAANAPQAGKTANLTAWADAALNVSGLHLAVEVRETDLHLWCWAPHCPDAPRLMARLSQAIHQDTPLPEGTPPLRRVCLYGRSLDAPASEQPPFETPDWTVRFSIQPQHRPAVAPTTAPERVAPPPHQPEAIVQTVERALQPLSTEVWISVKRLENHAQGRRLWIACESAYAPDPALLARPIARCLRDLELPGFRDAVLLGQVSGETRPEWKLRVDLTPSDRTLDAWARWGDVAALAARLNQALESFGLQVSAILKESTLHLVASPQHEVTSAVDFPSQSQISDKLSAVLNALAPRGILGVTAYGVDRPYEASFPTPKTPVWVTWLDLPAKHRPDLVPSALELAKGGSISALTFVLERLLNPDLTEKLATGGIRVQIRRKGDVLHVMTEGLTCPGQNTTAPQAVKFLQQLQLANVGGVRVYGRRSGQRKPRWSYGVDFDRRAERPLEVPDFSLSDLPNPPLTTSEDLNGDRDLDAAIAPPATPKHRLTLSQILCATTLFRQREAMPASNPEQTHSALSRPTVAVWAVLGLLFAAQVDWMASAALERRERANAPTPVAEVGDPSVDTDYNVNLPELPQSAEIPEGAFNTSGFTAPSHAAPVVLSETAGNATLIPPPEIDFPTFNSEQMDRQLALYRDYVETFGVPDVLVVGSSRALRGIDPKVLQATLAEQGYENVRVFNLGINGATAQVVNLLLTEILPPDRLPGTIIWTDGARAFNSGREDVTYNAIVRSPGYEQLQRGFRPIESAGAEEPVTVERSLFERIEDRYVDLDDRLNALFAQHSATYPQRDELKAALQRVGASESASASPAASTAEPTAETIDLSDEPILHENGFLALSDRFDPPRYYRQHPKVSGAYDGDYAAFQLQGIQSVALRSAVEFAQSQKIDLVFVNLPLTDTYLDPVRTQYEQQFVAYMLEVSQDYGFAFRNFAQLWPQQHDYFSDPSHLNRFGAAAVSQRLAQSPTVPWPQPQSETTENTSL